MRQLTLSTDKDKYGIRLKAEPDHMVLGKRLKGAFKSVTAAIRELTSEQLEVFQKTGTSPCLRVRKVRWGQKSSHFVSVVVELLLSFKPFRSPNNPHLGEIKRRSLKCERRWRNSLPAEGERQPPPTL